MEKEKLVFEAPEKPEMENIKDVIPNTEDFNEPEKAEAVMKSLNLEVGDTVRDDGDGEEYTINPKMVLKGDAPEKYKQEVDKAKIILTDKEKEGIGLYYRKKKENSKIRDKLYYGIKKRVEKLYYWDDDKKTHKPKTNSKRSIEICDALDWIHNNNYMSGFSNLIYHILSKENQDFVYCYKCAWFNRDVPNIQEWREENDGSYRVLTDSEADISANDYLTDDEELWKMAVESGNTTLGIDEWAEQITSYDGRGQQLAGYDGCEEYEDVNGTTYYIYRTN